MTDLLSAEDIRSCPILYVDDEPDNLLGFQMTLRRKFTILTAESGAEALEILAREPVGVVVADQRMPGMTGVELITRAKDMCSDTVFLILTAYSDFDAMIEGINTGALSGYISKPWEKEYMEMRLSNAVEQHLLATQLRQRNTQLMRLNHELEGKVRERTRALQDAADETSRVNVQLTELNRLKNDFISFCSHDLKSPLNAIVGFIDLLELRAGKIEGFDVISGTLQSMREVAEEMTSLVHHVLDLSRLDSGREQLSRVSTPLAETIERAISKMGPLAEQKGISLDVHLEPDLPAAWHDRARINQVVSNLIGNAVKFTEAGGHITVRLRAGGNDRQVVDVEDNGIGMPPEMCEAAFTEGQQHRRAGTDGEASSGLGLGICHRIVTMHGGEIGVRSREGVGSIFTFTLPEDPRDRERVESSGGTDVKHLAT